MPPSAACDGRVIDLLRDVRSNLVGPMARRTTPHAVLRWPTPLIQWSELDPAAHDAPRAVLPFA